MAKETYAQIRVLGPYASVDKSEDANTEIAKMTDVYVIGIQVVFCALGVYVVVSYKENKE